MNDTWVYFNQTWTNLTPTLNVSPPARYFAASAIDALGKDLLFGGKGLNGPLDDTWTFTLGKGGHWVNLTGLSKLAPSPRYLSNLDFLFPPYKLFLFGGTNGVSYFNDLWIFSWRSGWHHSATGGTPPPPRAGAAFGEDARSYSGYVEATMFGGYNSTTVFRDTWVLNSTFGTSLFGWHLVSHMVSPPAMFGMASLGHWTSCKSGNLGFCLFIFGGSNGSSTFGETWFTDYTFPWHRLTPSPHPSARSFTALENYGGSKLMYIFGGLSSSGTPLADAWTYTP